MGAFEVIAAYKTNPGAVVSATAAYEGQSLQVRATPEGSETILQQCWANNKTGGIVRVRSPRMHDDVQGIRARVGASDQRLLLPAQVREKLYSTDTLTVETTGGEAETDDVALLMHYSSLPGSEGDFRTWEEVQPQVEQYMGVEVTLESAAAVGKWGAGVALNNAMDVFKKPSRYAILGYHLDLACTAISLRGTDIGEVRCGGPGALEPDLTGDWFIRLSQESGEPAIPVFNSQNVGNILAECADNEAKVQRHVTFLCALLRS